MFFQAQCTEITWFQTDNRRTCASFLKGTTFEWVEKKYAMIKEIAKLKRERKHQQNLVRNGLNYSNYVIIVFSVESKRVIFIQVNQAYCAVAKTNNQLKEQSFTITNLQLEKCSDVDKTNKRKFRCMYRDLYRKYMSQKGSRQAEWDSRKQEVAALNKKVCKFENKASRVNAFHEFFFPDRRVEKGFV